jgi:hypothetical protein
VPNFYIKIPSTKVDPVEDLDIKQQLLPPDPDHTRAEAETVS